MRIGKLSWIAKLSGIFDPIAVKLYNLKIFGRQEPEKNAGNLLSPVQVKILSISIQKSEQQLQTMGALMNAIASLGGHLKHNGFPGWQVMARAYEKLLQLEMGWLMATQQSVTS